MIVKVMGQGPGVAPAAPRTRTGGQPPAGRATAPRAAAGAAPSSVSAAGSRAPQELFDANGDGTIENWSFLHGGDSFATFDPPPPGTDTTRSRHSSDSTLHAADRSRPGDGGHSGTPAAIHHAHSAYRRDGMAGAPIATPSGNAPTPAAPPAPVPRSGGGTALPSSK